MKFSPHLLDRSISVSIADDRAACAGMFDLFDSTKPTDHRVARDICGTCDVIAACRRNLRDEKSRIPGGRPSGTWAGMLFASDGGGKTSASVRGAA